MRNIPCNKCSQFYDADQNAVCPYCNGKREIGVTRPLDGALGASAPAFPKNAPVAPAAPASSVGNWPSPAAIPKTAPVIGGEIGRTQALHMNEANIDPVRGWLVCIKGKKEGLDFKIHSESNLIGRGKSNDVCLDFDDSVSKDAHAYVNYDVAGNQFWLIRDPKASNIYLSGKLVLEPMELKKNDIIKIGKTELMFIPCCDEAFTWPAE